MTRVEQVVVGVGNPIMGDDGLGKHVVERVAEADPGASVAFAGTTAFLALEAMSGADRAIVVDAVNVPDAEPGSIHRYPLSSSRTGGSSIDVLMHDFSFGEALDMGEAAYDLPDEIVLLGMVPERVETGDALSDVVADRLPELIDRVLAELEGPIREPTPP